MPSPHNLLKVFNDSFTPVRALDGTLLGVVPKVRDTDEALLGSNGAMFELRIAAQVCVCVNVLDPLQSTQYLDGFIPIDRPQQRAYVEPTTDGEDPDIAVGV